MPDPGSDVAVYVHWPYCARICPYCDFNVVRARGREAEAASLVEAILADLDRQAELLGPRRLASVFFGGGTPSLMNPEAVARIVDRVATRFRPTGPVEITLEANPTDAEADRSKALVDAGVNRLSLGVQAFDDADLAFLGRNHSAAEARRAVRLAGDAFGRLSIDLIYGLPGQTAQAWADDLRAAVDMGFEHISPYQLTIEPGTAFGRAVARKAWIPPDEALAAELYETTQAVLAEAGFEAYEVSNHARRVAARSAHNLHVWRGGDYLGLGPGAHGRITLNGVRTSTIARRDVAGYVASRGAGAAWSDVEALDPREAAEERLLLGLRTIEGVSVETFAELGLTPEVEPVRGLVDDGLLIHGRDRIAVSDRGRPVLDAVLRALLV